MYKYLEIKHRGTQEVVKRLDVTNKSDRTIDRAEIGMNINLNHTDYYTNQNFSIIKLEEISNQTQN